MQYARSGRLDCVADPLCISPPSSAPTPSSPALQVAKLQAEAEKLISEARAAAQKQVADAKAAVSAECAKELAEAKAVRAGRCWGWARAAAGWSGCLHFVERRALL